ncbi:hypothetical protein [uncultured Tenacibaculum sp.]|nr:hypothetical protein [uncultured Tenacibaculum sp.]
MENTQLNLLTSGRDEEDEFNEMQSFLDTGDVITIAEDIGEAELVVRGYL